MSEELKANIGPLTLHLTAEALGWLASEWAEIGRDAPLDDVVSAVLNRMAAELVKMRQKK